VCGVVWWWGVPSPKKISATQKIIYIERILNNSSSTLAIRYKEMLNTISNYWGWLKIILKIDIKILEKLIFRKDILYIGNTKFEGIFSSLPFSNLVSQL